MAKKTTAASKRGELSRLSADTKRNLLAMLRLTDELLGDSAYVEKHGGESALLDDIEAKEFAHFGGTPSLLAMLRAYRANPNEETWKENGYNVRVMIDLADPKESREATTRTNWKALAAEWQQKAESLEQQLNESRELNRELREKIDEQSGQIGEMRGQLKMLRAPHYAA